MERGTLNQLIFWLLLLKKLILSSWGDNWLTISGGSWNLLSWVFLLMGVGRSGGGGYRAKMRIKAWIETMVFKRLHWRTGFCWPATLSLWPAAITGICATIVDVIVCLNKNSLHVEISISSSTWIQLQRVLPTKMQKFMKKHEVILCPLSQGLIFFLFHFVFKNFKY